MPNMNGFETARLIKARQRTRFIPIIFLTAISKDAEYVFRGYSVGAVDYMFKPFQAEILRSKVQVFVELHLQQRRLADQEQRLRDIERQDLELRHMRELLQSEARFSEIVRSAMDAIVLFDADGKIFQITATAEKMFGTTAPDALGTSITSFFPEATGANLMTTICSTAERMREGSTEAGGPEGLPAEAPHSFIARRANAETFPIEASLSCLDTSGRRTYTLIARDVSERKRQE